RAGVRPTGGRVRLPGADDRPHRRPGHRRHPPGGPGRQLRRAVHHRGGGGVVVVPLHRVRELGGPAARNRSAPSSTATVSRPSRTSQGWVVAPAVTMAASWPMAASKATRWASSNGGTAERPLGPESWKVLPPAW